MICMLKFNFIIPYSCFFLNFWLLKLKFGKHVSLVSQYYCENALISYSMRKYRGSVIAWSCICLALEVITQKEIFSSKIWDNCPFESIKGDSVKHCGSDLLKILKKGDVKNLAIYKKFSQPQYFGIAPTCS